ncbi:MAG: hypothetical protein K6E29_07965 [Cyanobacteria bacterium RUI128]|nr:hypothetical protein [Cyanobacteria bacterium RUI128]
MYVNKCIKCGAEFETKNPKRVICPNCLYAEKGAEESTQGTKSYSSYSSYSAGEDRNDRPRQYNNDRGGYNRNNNNNRSFNNNNRRYNNDNRNNDGGGGYQQRRGFNNNRNQGGGGYGGNNRGGFGGGGQRRPNNRFQQGGNRRPGGRPQPKKQAKPLLISKEQLEKIEALYKTMLPLPNPDAHEVIGAHLEIEPRKVFFGINLVRQKLMLPKLPFPKRKLAVTPDQMTAIKSLYTPLLPLPPIGCHKIIAAQLRVDEWRVHVAIKLIRAQMGLDRWNEDRPDKPADYLVPKYPKQEEAQKATEAKDETKDEPAVTEEEAPKKRGRKKAEETEAPAEAAEEAPKKRGRKKKEDAE